MLDTYLVQSYGLKLACDAVHSLADTDDKTAMYDKLGKLRAALVAITPMPQEQLCKVTKLVDGEIGCETRLPSFFAHNADSNVRGLDHRHIITSVTDTADALLGIILDEAGDFGFLSRRTAACDYCREKDCG